ncbi:MAG: flagellar hook assembly protein FlgD [Alphaproteobacteria bacterium]|nr:flagellar hook assembly protein FlgD [Alphaproteobacteria bacterium]
MAAISGIAPGTSSQAEKSSLKLAETFDNFLTLLTKQLQYQDPLKPMDSSQFTSQLVQFTGVEQAVSTNKNLEKLLSAMQGNQFSAMVGAIDKTLEAEGGEAGLVGGSATWSYKLESQAIDNKLKIADADGRVVRTLSGSTDTQRHEITWDGTDEYGRPLPDGVYTLTVDAKSFNTSIGAAVTSIGRIDGISTADGVQNFMIGAYEVPMTKIKSLKSGN